MAETDTQSRTALVTGASSGIGWELADVAAGDGYDVVLTARREERLRELADKLEKKHGVRTTVISQDLAVQNAAETLFESVQDEGLEIHTLVNNAGIPNYGDFLETDREAEQGMMQLNTVTLTELTKLFGREMSTRGDGAILNTASLAALYPIPKKAVYAATKSYVLSFSRAVAHELEDEGITVTALCPGVVETEYADRGNVDDSNTMDGITNDPRTVAKAGWDGLQNGERIVFPSTFATYGAQAVRILPRKMITKLGESTVEEGQSWI
ncbi:short-chain dehydrogenase/reductase SDR [Halalkaliarchaeum desulfuricum]|uniref:Short-chain dehydrogenase/reductase SDR n=1 Tax=Halalkaliarchaeum desulfuricum TaxID=2055893 RepID=A0A343TK70_9EURY|nr:SDR family oxidoreductase [Halalkaliarchaeum desulfuricum]AUX09492.1 short-chain dehydrogenase/reductase SDR [Halalkaliarchaeum desulfuricum]